MDNNDYFIGKLAHEIIQTFQKGEMISSEWLYPKLATVNPYAKDHDNYTFMRNQILGALREELGSNHLYWLDLSRNGMFKLLKAREHQHVAANYLQAGINKAFLSAGRVLASTDLKALTNEQIKDHNDTLSAVGTFKQLTIREGRNVWGNFEPEPGDNNDNV